jgi:hypothetical protein
MTIVESTTNLAGALDALRDALLMIDAYDVVEGDRVPEQDFWAVVAAAKQVLSANPIVEGRSCEAHDRLPCYTCAAVPPEAAPTNIRPDHEALINAVAAELGTWMRGDADRTRLVAVNIVNSMLPLLPAHRMDQA